MDSIKVNYEIPLDYYDRVPVPFEWHPCKNLVVAVNRLLDTVVYHDIKLSYDRNLIAMAHSVTIPGMFVFVGHSEVVV